MAGTRNLMAGVVMTVGLLALPAMTNAEVLYDQTDNAGTVPASSSGPNFSPSNDFGPNGYESTADDFTVPVGQTWSINEVDVGGVYASPGATPPVNAYLFSDDSGKPGTEIYSQNAIPAPGGPNYTVPLTGAPNLSTGTYWVTVQQADTGSDYWSWQTRTVQGGAPAQWVHTTASMFSCFPGIWRPRTTCWTSTDPDQDFKLQGTRTLSNRATVSLGKPTLNKRTGTAKEPVTVSDPGTLVISGKGVAVQNRSIAAPGTEKVTIKTRGKAKKHLNRIGHVKTAVTAVFTLTTGDTISANRPISLKKKLR
jgi:hypothetical protein